MFNQTLEHRSRRLAAGTVGFAVGLASVMYLSRSQVKEAVVEEISDVATRSLGDEKMQLQAQQMTMQTLQARRQWATIVLRLRRAHPTPAAHGEGWRRPRPALEHRQNRRWPVEVRVAEHELRAGGT